MKYRFGKCEFEAESKYLTLQMRESNDIINDTDALRKRLADDGFLLIRDFHDADEVLDARRDMLAMMAHEGKLDPAAPMMDGVVHPDPKELATSSVRGREHLKTDSLKRVVYGPRTMGFFDRLLGGESMSYNFQWLRTAGPGAASGIHADVVYMGRGSHKLVTCWTPFGHITPDMGPLVVCERSHQWEQVIQTYGRSDVDRDRTQGLFSNDPAELVDRFGGRWVTTTFEPGDAVIVSIFNLHGSLTNMSNKYRISCDTRYQPAGEPIDDRWAGAMPRTHDAFWAPETKLETVESSRARWGV
ncbi:MAG: phytanoyl-CoA dioxygenase family protein [Planctomycetaceae bacterium]|nr:phytanoyl-CoA dioxygenase family protein [Planctomycetaceae bacterium]